MRITFLGAAEMVTGSCYLLESDNIKLLVDCGMFQGGKQADELNYNDFEFNPAEIDYLILTHAHIDHSGRIPQLAKKGFKGRILATAPTAELCQIMLPDSAFIQEMENEWLNRKRQRAGKPPVEAIYTVEDARESLKFFDIVKYNELINVGSNITVRYRNAGHILGASIIEMWVREKGDEFKIVFSGDLGNKNAPLMQDPSIIEDADYVLVESTYGNRLHKDTKNKALALLDIITDTIEKKGNIVIPSFAIERTQEILYELNMLKESKAIKLKDIPVFVDSPLAINATKIFMNHVDNFDEDTLELIKQGDDPFNFPNLIFTETPEESRGINTYEGSCIIISASGMCDAGRIKHHLKHNLWREESSVVFVGYQAKESLGRRILEGDKNVKIFGEDIIVKCNVYSIEGFSGHADQAGIMEWLSGFTKKPAKIFLTHGEDDALETLSKLITEKLGIKNEIAKLGQTVELISGTHAEVVAERYVLQKQNVLSSIDTLKNRFAGILDKLKQHISSNEDVKLDTLSYFVENVENALDKIDDEIK